ncbi:MAG: type I-F CRISPR-associated helicase Cas3, partial [Gammaproteobacteria bacterium]|nr:type I-F CRISPR-associated helicase Cas3 [Gammaproteobacteria bacterium]
MNILLVSECDKRALVETRRILDQFAERRGERTWQTPITQNGLDTLRRLLRKTARKNTSVACHWIRGLNHSELLWVVGDRSRFNAQGAVPTNFTLSNVLRREDEDDWHSGEEIYLLSALAALLHDLGKASVAFQRRLIGQLTERNVYRHEWVSLRLFEAFVGEDDDARWLARLCDPTPQDDSSWLARLRRDGIDGDHLPAPLASLRRSPVGQAVGWLVVTHHRLPTLPHDSDGHLDFQLSRLQNVIEHINSAWNEPAGQRNCPSVHLYWEFTHGLPVTTTLWRKRASRIARRLLARVNPSRPSSLLSDPYVMHLARLGLMLADHHYSRLKGDDSNRVKVPKGYPLYANTSGPGRLNQTLDEHLIGVALLSGEFTRSLPRFDRHLPRLARHKGLRKRSSDERFRWQDKAAELAASLREQSMRDGVFVVNMASTGCGKTLANARVMYALADPERGMRCAFALGLRALTLQTGRAFRDLLNLSDEELAIRVGGSASRELFEHYAAQAEADGSASAQSLLDESTYVHFEGNSEADSPVHRVIQDPAVRAMLLAPVLVCTIDHLTPATESQRGGRQIAPMLRLLSSDLVLDEPDDFDIDDLPALTSRLLKN